MLLLSVAAATLFGPALRGKENQTPALPPQADTPVSVEGIEIREADSGAELRIRADAALIWTQYRALDDRLVLEMPNTTVDSSVHDLTPQEGLLSSVTLQRETTSRRPLLRLVIATRQEAQHTLEKDADMLVLRFTPTGASPTESTELEVEPRTARRETDPRFELDSRFEADDSPPESGATEAHAEATISGENGWPGTADEPYRSPPPVGTLASQLEGVEILERGPETSVLVAGDGAFSYRSFQLENPDRFVIDLEGVVATSGSASVSVGGPAVERVRMAQYQSSPQPVSRVVFDLSRPVLPVISGSADGLTVRFPLAAAALSQEPTVLTAELPEPEIDAQLTDEELLLTAVAAESEADLPTFELAAEQETPSLDPIEETIEVESAVVAVPATDADEQAAPIVPAAPVIAALAPSAGLETEPELEPEPELAPESELAPEVLPERLSETVPSTEEEQNVELAQASPEVIEVDPAPAEEPVSLLADRPRERSRAETLIAQVEPAQPPPIPEVEPEEEREPFVIERVASAATRDDALVQGEGVLRPGFGTRNMSGEKQYYGEPISLSVRNADITEILRTIARISGLNMVIQPGISGGVTVELEAVPWDQALEQILKLHALGMELDGNILRIVPIDVLAAEADQQLRLQAAKALAVPLSTIMRRVSYAQASEIATILRSNRGGQGVLSQRGSVVVDNRTNTLIIQELPGNLDSVLDIVQNLDTPEEQVMIEARIVETSKSWSRSLGIQWGFSGVSGPATGNTSGLQFPNNGTVEGGANLFTGGNNGFLNIGLGNVLNTFELDVALIAAENEGLVNVISAPKIATLNNERASIQSGLQIPIQTVANNTVTVQFVNATLRLDVTPHVTADGTILMEIHIQKREPQLAFAVVGATNAPIATREVRTRVLVRDGGTTVIGGIYEVSTDDSEDRVPGLANIPILGRLFKNKNRRNENEELLIFITPRIIRF